jgi:hypothetical protein
MWSECDDAIGQNLERIRCQSHPCTRFINNSVGQVICVKGKFRSKVYGWSWNTILVCTELPAVHIQYRTPLIGKINFDGCTLVSWCSDVLSCRIPSKHISGTVKNTGAHPACYLLSVC